MQTDIEKRIEELEIKAAFAEDLVETLNRTVFRQQEQLEVLQRQLDDLRRQIQSMPAGGARSLRDEIPPHY
jgi:SlyX protein